MRDGFAVQPGRLDGEATLGQFDRSQRIQLAALDDRYARAAARTDALFSAEDSSTSSRPRHCLGPDAPEALSSALGGVGCPDIWGWLSYERGGAGATGGSGEAGGTGGSGETQDSVVFELSALVLLTAVLLTTSGWSAELSCAARFIRAASQEAVHCQL
jgi:hypothetical protein